jgi:hypothetical protein
MLAAATHRKETPDLWMNFNIDEFTIRIAASSTEDSKRAASSAEDYHPTEGRGLVFEMKKFST